MQALTDRVYVGLSLVGDLLQREPFAVELLDQDPLRGGQFLDALVDLSSSFRCIGGLRMIGLSNRMPSLGDVHQVAVEQRNGQPPITSTRFVPSMIQGDRSHPSDQVRARLKRFLPRPSGDVRHLQQVLRIGHRSGQPDQVTE